MLNPKHSLVLLLIVVSCYILQGCSPIYYQPNTHNVPLFYQKGEGSAALHLSNKQSEIQAAYAISNHAYGLLNTQFVNHPNDSDGDGGKGNILDLGAGYFTLFPSGVLLEAGGFVGGGNLENHFPSTQTSSSRGNIQASISKAGIQSSLGLRGRYLEGALSIRFTHLQYSSISGDLVFDKKDQVTELRNNASQWLMEPALTFRAGIDPVKFQLQFGGSNNLTDVSFRQRTKYLSIGLIVRINRKSNPLK